MRGKLGDCPAARRQDLPFNEARANCAGNSWRTKASRRMGLPSMRPAQIAREIQPPRDGHHVALLAFNEARANCAGNYRLPPEPSPRAALPSMRPAQIAREIAAGAGCNWRLPAFNEARANCAGNSRRGGHGRRDARTFNEARANCAGNFAGAAAAGAASNFLQ